MKKAVDLKKLIEEMDVQIDQYNTYVNRKTGEIIRVSSDRFRKVMDYEITPPYNNYQDWEIEEIKNCEDIADNYDDYVEIPSKSEIDEYSVMECFCLSIEDNKMRNELCRAVKGKGAFRRVRDRIERYDSEDEWYQDKKERLQEIAIAWCEENGLKYK